MRALTTPHVRDIWPILAILVILVLPAAMFLVQASRVRRVARAAARDGAPAAGRIRILTRPDVPSQWHADLVQLVRSSLTDTLGAAGDQWTVDVGPPPSTHPRVIVEIAAADDAGYAAAMLVDTLRTRLAQSLPVAPADIDVRLTPTPG